MKLGILWGAGLGDLLVLRPFVMEARAAIGVDCQVSLLSTANHLPGVYREILGDIEFVQLLPSGWQFLRQLQQYCRYFDVLYVGPYPTVKTRLLASLLRPGEIWSGRRADVAPFILEQVAADTGRFSDREGLGPTVFPYATLPWQMELSGPVAEGGGKPYVVIHPGSKDRWQTKEWPLEKWVDFTGRVVTQTHYTVYAVGTRNEQSVIDALVAGVKGNTQKTVHRCLDWPLADIAALIQNSSGVVCHNSGVLHMATFLRKQTLALTGASAKYWQPPYDWVRNISSRTCGLHCNCYRCPIPGFKAKCINRLSVGMIWEAFEQHIVNSDSEIS